MFVEQPLALPGSATSKFHHHEQLANPLYKRPLTLYMCAVKGDQDGKGDQDDQDDQDGE